MMTPICPRFLNLTNDFVLLRFRARTPEDLSAIEVIHLLVLFITVGLYDAVNLNEVCGFDRGGVENVLH